MTSDYDGGRSRWVMPTLRSAVQTSPAADGAVNGPVTVTAPSGIQLGDYLVVAMGCNQDAITPPSGWTALQDGVSSGTAFQAILYGKVAAAADVGVASWSWTMQNTNAAPVCVNAYAFEGVDSTKVVSAISAESTTGASGTSFTTPNVTTTVPSRRLHFIGCRSASSTTITFSWGSGATKSERANSASVSYTSSTALEDGFTYGTGSISGRSATSAGTTNTSLFGFHLALGATLSPSSHSPNLSASLRASL